MPILTEAEKERIYDLERSGQIYTLAPAGRPTFAEYAASNPESRALYDTLSPEARRLADKLIGILDRMPDSEVDQAIDQTPLVLDDLAKLPATPTAELRAQLDPIDELRAQIAASTDYDTRYRLLGQLADLTRARTAALEAVRFNVLIGSIDDYEVRASYAADQIDPDNDVLFVATVVWQGIKISTDGDSYLSLPMDGGCDGAMEIAQWDDVKRVAHTDISERLIALARRYPRFQDVPELLSPITSVPPTSVTVMLTKEDTNWCSYQYGAAALDVEEDQDATIQHMTFLIGGHEVTFKGSELPAVRDLASLLHNHDVQNTLEFLHGDRPAAITLSHLEPTHTRDRFDNDCIHEYETGLCEAMARMGLSDVAMRDLFGHVLEIADAIAIQQRMDGYKEGYDNGVCHALDVIEAKLNARKAA